MKIGYDAKRAFLNNTGLGNFSRWLIKTTAKHYPDNTYLLYTPKLKPNKWRNFFDSFSNIQIITPAGKYLTALWRSKGVVSDVQKDGVEIYHGLSYELPMGIRNTGIKTVVTIHDLIFLRFPQYYGWIDRFIYTAKTKHACKTADRVIAISERTKQDLVELLHIDSKKIEVIYQGCAPEFSIKQSEAQMNLVKQKYNLPDEFILNVGTIEERKNLMLLAKSLCHVKTHIPVVVVGKATPYLDEVKAFLSTNNLNDSLLFKHDVSFDDLPAVYQSASLFVYPSRYEGFGIPVLEALVSGTPVIAATGSCLEEAGGEHSRYISPDDERGLAKQIDEILLHEELRRLMISEGLHYAQRFQDRTLAAQMMNIYQTLQADA
ncbi:glycosyltransferase family 4 protein [Mucilaginibacter psychrotolerans]|uniref:Glycosyltransferase family 1 protein n=1 Tax=Mucilaginibacter psychrotolerans TaxID=1524096 RepID=A0A4Y8SES0_9SPHI|nr:glycosyltransferase family 1 protein [Mucilaginibacter psychrotolerans]TFF36886.1 glycosyltransferase family 1 protein [Mucilaginibacter psychrotolerans]